MCCRVLSRGVQSSDLVWTGPSDCCVENSLKQARAEAGNCVRGDCGIRERKDSGSDQVTAAEMARRVCILDTFEGKSSRAF